MPPALTDSAARETVPASTASGLVLARLWGGLVLALAVMVGLLGSGGVHAAEAAEGAATTEALITATYFLPPGYIAYEDGDRTYFVGGTSSSWYRHNAADVFGADEDDDDEEEDDGPPPPYDDATLARLALAQKYGVQFPEGSAFLYSRVALKLKVRSSPAVLDRIARILHWEYGKTRYNVRTTVTVVRIGTGTAADWGLDGLPPVRPESSPFGGPVPRVMSPTQSARFFAALRRTDGFETVATTEVVTISGQTTSVRGMDVEHQGQLGKKEWLGMRLSVTPSLYGDERTLDMKLWASYTDVIGRRGSPGTGVHGTDRQITEEHAIETRVIMRQGQTLLLGAAKRRAPRDSDLFPNSARSPADPRPVFFILSATVERVESQERQD